MKTLWGIRYIVRTFQILFLSLLFLAKYSIKFVKGDEYGPALVRWYFIACGGGFIKLGQILAMRYDLLPFSYCAALADLLDSLPADSSEDIMSIIQDDLGKSVHNLFASFNREPLSTASVAQVHEAELLTGDKVVLKVLRPRIEGLFRIDLLNFKIFANLMDSFGIFGKVQLSKLAEEFSRSTKEELDLRIEARNAHKLHVAMSEDHVAHYSPKVYFEYSSRRVLVLERLDGIWIKEIIASVQTKDTVTLSRYAERGIDTSDLAKTVLHSTLTQMFRHRFFHADPHAGNLIVLKDNRLGFLDFGIVGWLDEYSWSHQFELRGHIAAKRIHASYESILRTLEPLPVQSLVQFEHEVKLLIRDWILSSETPQTSIQQKSSGKFFFNLFSLLRRNNLHLPVILMNLYRTMIIADMVMLALDPEIDWVPELEEFMRTETEYQVQYELRNQVAQSRHHLLALKALESQDAAIELMNWVRYRLPVIGRGFQEQLSRIERVFLILLNYSRMLLSGVLILIVSGFIFGLILKNSFLWLEILYPIRHIWRTVVIILVFVIFVLGRLIGQLKSET